MCLIINHYFVLCLWNSKHFVEFGIDEMFVHSIVMMMALDECKENL